MKTKLIIIILFALLISGCADVETVKNCTTGHTYGFWGGLWHGIVAPISFIGELFFDDIAVYAHNNNGSWYDFGFLIGVGAFVKGSSSASSKD